MRVYPWHYIVVKQNIHCKARLVELDNGTITVEAVFKKEGVWTTVSSLTLKDHLLNVILSLKENRKELLMLSTCKPTQLCKCTSKKTPSFNLKEAIDKGYTEFTTNDEYTYSYIGINPYNKEYPYVLTNYSGFTTHFNQYGFRNEGINSFHIVGVKKKTVTMWYAVLLRKYSKSKSYHVSLTSTYPSKEELQSRGIDGLDNRFSVIEIRSFTYTEEEE
jgi:hypothetical protein